MFGYEGQVIGGVELGEWLEDGISNRSRYAVEGSTEESVWICTECEQLEDDCDCGNEWEWE